MTAAILVVTGTDTGVGKTIATAAIAAAAGGAGPSWDGLRVAVVKPGQTGISWPDPDRPDAGDRPVMPQPESDTQTVVRLAAPACARTLASYPHPLAPFVAAAVAHLPPLGMAHVADAVRELAGGHDLVIIEGAGGLLVPMGPGDEGSAADGLAGAWTVADLAAALSAPVVVVTRASLGTLNHTALTLEALARRDLPALVVIGEWPNEPQLVHRTNLHHLPGELAGVLPERAGRLAPARFRASAPTWLTPALYGEFDVAAFRVNRRLSW